MTATRSLCVNNNRSTVKDKNEKITDKDKSKEEKIESYHSYKKDNFGKNNPNFRRKMFVDRDKCQVM